MERIESVRRAVLAWRREHRRGPLPVLLRDRVGALTRDLGADVVGAALGVRPAVVRRWQERYGRSEGRRRRAPRGFVELRPELAPPASLLVEVTSSDGRVVRIQGALDAPSIVAVLSGALPREET